MFKIIIYLHEEIDNDILAGMLKKNNFGIIRSTKVGMINRGDDKHLKSAFIGNAVVLTSKIDFPNPHPNIRHKGVLIAKPPMTPANILAALNEVRRQIEEHECL